MATKIVMPQLGESVVEGTVGEWLVEVGAQVEEYEAIVRVSTDKVDTEIPAPASGVLLKILIEEGETVDSGVVLGMIGEPGEETDDSDSSDTSTNGNGHHETEQLETMGVPLRAKQKADYSGHMTPVVARMVEQHDIDLSQIEGTGRNGRIRKKDVQAYLEGQASTETEPELAPWEVPASGDLFKPTVNYEDELEAKPQPKPQKASVRPQPKSTPVTTDMPGELVALSSMRRSIAQHMVESKLHTAPHVTTVMEVDLHNVTQHRDTNKDDFAKRGVKLTFTPYFVAACAKALQEVPELNARWTDDGLFLNHVQHIGMAVAIDDGLIVPVIKNAQDYNLAGLARQVNDLAERARNRQLQPDEIRGGTFTITNHGVSGSLLATPIINQPQSAILGVGMIEKRVKVMNDAIAIRPCAYLSLTFDHRVADGATADAFLMRVKQILENWS
jgi:pyruvate/2-oxoglutarate dehydrogenase complex dihydrolipoamide acyltransferase (E2) component